MLLLLIVLFAAIAFGIVSLIFVLMTSAIAFARVAFGLLAALVLTQSVRFQLVPDNGFLNYVAWAIIALGLIFLLSALPRVDVALRFFSTILMSELSIMIVLSLMGGLIGSIIGKDFAVTTVYELVIKGLCLILSAIAIFLQVRKSPYDPPDNILLRLTERVLASLIFGGAIAFLCGSLHNNWRTSDLMLILAFAGSSVAAFVFIPRLMRMIEAQNIEPREISMPK